MLFTRKPGQITRHPHAIETLIEGQTQILQNWSQLVYLSGVTFEVRLEKKIFTQKPQQITQHIDKRGKKRETYIPCKLKLVCLVH